MDGQRFDDLARVLARGASRRQVLRGLTAGAVGGTAVALGFSRPAAEVAAADCIGGGGTCAADSDCCAGGLCNPNGQCYCDDPDRPGIGCACTTGADETCGLDSLECCAGVCVRAGACHPVPKCAEVGDACSDDGACCRDLVCGDGQTCGVAVTCAAEGGTCTDDGDCCADLVCGNANTCGAKPAPACVALGGACGGDGDCCQGTCGDAGVCHCQDPAQPALGCACTTGTDNPCADPALSCCPNSDEPGGTGVCTAASGGCNPTSGGDNTGGDPSDPSDVPSAPSGDVPSGGTSGGTTFGGNDKPPRQTVALPKTGSGTTTAAGKSWAAPLALIGAGAALVGARLRRGEETNRG